MAKKKASKKRPTVTHQPPAPVVHHHAPGHDFNPRSLESVAGASSKDFKYQSEAEPRLEENMKTIEENAGYVSEHWQERIRKEGKVYYTCPMCTGATKPKEYGKEGEKIIAAHIKKEHPMRVKEMKLKKAPKAAYTPERKIESPKRTLADAIHPKYRPQVEAQLKMREQLRPLAEQAKQISVHGNALLKLVTMTESQAIMQLRTLNNQDLIAIVQLASNRGKRLLSRAARKLCGEKHLSCDASQRDPSAKHLLIQEALKKSGSKIVVSHR